MSYSVAKLRGDVLGGITAAVVALPLSLAYGVASGMGAAAGLYGAIAVGFFAAVFGGTPTQVSGPTAPMAIVMAVVITSYAESLSEALTVVVLAGVLQDASRPPEARPIRGLYAVRGRFGLHDRDRCPRHGDSGPALSRYRTPYRVVRWG